MDIIQKLGYSKKGRRINAPDVPTPNHAAPNAAHLMDGHFARFQIQSVIEIFAVSSSITTGIVYKKG